MWEWITEGLLVYLLFRHILDMGRITKLEQLVRLIEIQSNKNEMGINKIYYFRETETINKNPVLTNDDLSAFKAELENANSILADRNKYLLQESK
jgi:hypothetical protein